MEPAPTAAAAEPRRRSPAKARAELAKVLLNLGYAAAGLALTLTPESSRFMGACAPTEALRVGAAAPGRDGAGDRDRRRAAALAGVLLMLAGCHGRVRGAHTAHFAVVLVGMFAAVMVAVVTSVR